MSHFTQIKTKIFDKKCLIEALENLNYIIEENVPIIGYGGRKHHGDVVIKTGMKYDIGFTRESDGSYKMVADWYGAARAVQRNQREFLDAVQKEYATVKVLKAVKKKGYQLKSRKITETGEIKLVVVKRGWNM